MEVGPDRPDARPAPGHPAPGDGNGDGDGGTRLAELELHDVRAFAEATFRPAPDGLTVLTGPNGSGKTTILEAIAFLGTHRSFRSADREAMVRTGADRAMVRSRFVREGRPLTVESELVRGRAPRTLVNRRPVSTRTALAEAVPVTVFSPEDLTVVQGPPARRRDLLDGAIRLLDHRAAADLDVLDRVLRQRAALLRQAGGRLTAEIETTLDVWDARLTETGSRVVAARRSLADALGPEVVRAYADLAGGSGAGGVGGAGEAGSARPGEAAGVAAVLSAEEAVEEAAGVPAPAGAAVQIGYRPSWEGPLDQALAERRADDVRRGVSTVGPHRDDLALALDGRDARTQASQGEQRSIALALRLAVHRLVTAQLGWAPILLLDDVFSELDPARSRSLVRHLPAGQAVLTTAGPLPDGADVAVVVDVRSLSAER